MFWYIYAFYLPQMSKRIILPMDSVYFHDQIYIQYNDINLTNFQNGLLVSNIMYFDSRLLQIV
jgi:uncharacterized membrane protein YobD (UPF0266 family)